ncbi:lytic transglycosylase domain-containing protein [Lentzea nigeriaca]|uniref:lytic transglycosylase domain-containing protein n=1 Tax=Lentzea nigeriaca TaxID=1128665 RepID=UPI001EF832F9|nr:lytic murein transglycosylase [Lentzea nigeriaca]
MAKLRGPVALTPRKRGFAVAALAAMLAPALIVGTKLVDWVNLSKHNDLAVALGPADVYGALRYASADLGASGRLPLSEELSAALLADLEDGKLDDPVDNDPGVIDDFPGDYGIPGVVLEAYFRAADKMGDLVPGCKLDWALLAGIGKVESNHANNGRVNAVGDANPKILGPVLNGAPGVAAIRDTDAGRLDGDSAWDRAVGPMQFIPGTWASYGADGNDDGNVNPNNVYDAALGAGRYLCAGGGDMTKQRDRAAAVFRYNNSTTYVETVLKWAKQYSENVDTLPTLPDNGNNVQNPKPTLPGTEPATRPPDNSGTSNPPASSTPPSSTPPSSTPNCPTPTSTSSTPPSSSTAPSSSTPSTSCPPSTPPSTPPSSGPSNPPQTDPSTPPQQTSSGTSQSSSTSSTEKSSSTAGTTSSAKPASSSSTPSSSLVTSTPS